MKKPFPIVFSNFREIDAFFSLQVLGVDIVSQAICDAEVNAKRNEIENTTFYSGNYKVVNVMLCSIPVFLQKILSFLRLTFVLASNEALPLKSACLWTLATNLLQVESELHAKIAKLIHPQNSNF